MRIGPGEGASKMTCLHVLIQVFGTSRNNAWFNFSFLVHLIICFGSILDFLVHYETIGETI